MERYSCHWSVNHGSTTGYFLEKNIKKAKKDLRMIAIGNCPKGNRYFYAIYDLDNSCGFIDMDEPIFERTGIKK